MAYAIPLKNWSDIVKIRDLIIDELAEGRSHEKKKPNGDQKIGYVTIGQK